MSIINEALKKTGLGLKQNQEKNIPLPSEKTARRLLSYALILVLSIFVCKFIFDLLGPKPQIIPAPQPVSTPQKIISLPSMPAEIKEGSFVLNGIFVSGTDGYAIVNNQIARKNETVDGAVVKEITEKKVVLEYKGRPVELLTKKY